MKHLSGWSVLQQFAPVQHSGVAPQQQCFARLSGGIDHGRIPRGEQLRQLFPQFLAKLVVQVDQRLIKQHQRSAFRQRPGQRHALLLTARQLGGVAIQKHLDMQARRQAAHGFVNVPFAAQLQGRSNVVGHLH